jgi:hypothetical protein
VKGFQPCHQLIATTARSSARHKLIWCSLRVMDSFYLVFHLALAVAPCGFSTTLLSDGRGAALRATPGGANINPASTAFSAERNSGMLAAVAKSAGCASGLLLGHIDDPGLRIFLQASVAQFGSDAGLLVASEGYVGL